MKQFTTFLCNSLWKGLKTLSKGGKALTALCLFICAIGSTYAQVAPHNEAFYLIGTMNGWITLSDDEAADYPYKLTDPDGDGTYTGSFFIPEGPLEFKVFSTTGGWSEADYFGFYGLYDFYVFNQDIPNFFISLTDGNYSNNIKIANWQGGTMTISMKWAQTYSGDYIPQILAIKGSNQPEAPVVPDIYIIGDFNNWRLPDTTSDNGALKTVYDKFDLVSMQFFIDEYFKAGNIRFALCKYDKEANEYEYLKLDSYYDCPFTLYKLSVNDQKYIFLSGEWISSSNPESLATVINDWQGGNIIMRINEYYDGTIEATVFNDSDVITEFPSDIYILLEYNGTKEIIPVANIAEHYFEAWANCYGQDVSITFTSENSENPNPENCWGIEKTLADYGIDDTNSYGRLFLVKGGKPFSYNFENSGELYVNVDFSLSQAVVSLTFRNTGRMYVVGEVEKDGVANQWLEPAEKNADFYNKYFRLTETSPGVFEGTYYIPESGSSLPNFRFYWGLTGWDGGASLGSGWDDFNSYEVNLNQGQVVLDYVVGGKGNWSPGLGSTWESNYVKMKVDTYYQTITLELTDDPSGGAPDIEYVSESSECWYTLQGIKVKEPQSGIYIHVKDGKSSVRILR